MRPLTQRTALIIILIFVTMHAAKTVAFIAFGQPPIIGDASHYWGDGHSVRNGDWLLLSPTAEIIRTPGYPWIVGLFQLCFGRFALPLLIAFQQILVFLTALATGWICGRLSGSRRGAVFGLGLSLLCFSQNSIAMNAFSDTLFCFLLTLAVGAWLFWLEKPTLISAAAIGFFIAVATLVRPIAQPLIVPILLVMIGSQWRTLRVRSLAWHVIAVLTAFSLALAPWYARNYRCFGTAFLAKTSGLTMWSSCFRGNPDDRFNPALNFSDAPETVRLLSQLGDVDRRRHWDVYRKLQSIGYTDSNAIDAMQVVCMQAIRAQPVKFIKARLCRFAWFWVTPNGTRRPNSGEIHPMTATYTKLEPSNEAAPEGTYLDQCHWQWAPYFRDGILNCIWIPNVWFYLATTLAAFAGTVAMIIDRRKRAAGIGLGLLLSSVAAMTAISAPPEYRYRMILEPMIVVCVVGLIELLLEKRTKQADA